MLLILLQLVPSTTGLEQGVVHQEMGQSPEKHQLWMKTHGIGSLATHGQEYDQTPQQFFIIQQDWHLWDYPQHP